jgi:hypothetical protein
VGEGSDVRLGRRSEMVCVIWESKMLVRGAEVCE